ncbi:immunoglobulin-like domain-containing protein [Listeria booriae]|uniref:Bacterial Ig domain-containing protein n=1 Tax=Listeria booriae TaxID=1552123 RepID=A0A7X0WE87_9LIST|nr:immunoglobulin-like domain-containing protein [Listeria booriae]MBC1332082.1 hypothetical protein [Listeria booriae]
MKELFLKRLRVVFVVISIICLVTVSFSANIGRVHADTAVKEDYYTVLKQLTEQVEKEDHTPLQEKVTWKFKWLVFTDVTFNQENATPEHRTLDSNDQRYAKVVADDFKKSLEAANPNILVDIDLEMYTTPIQVTTSNNDFILHESQIADVLAAKVPYGAYDSIFALSDSLGGGGVTKATYYSDITRGAAYSGIGLSKLHVNNYPEHSTDRTIEYSTDIALHEFCHQMQMAGLIDSYPDVHGSTTYGYTNDPKNGWMKFYTDYLTGNVKDPKTGKLIGVYPEMWRLTPRYLQEIVPIIRGGIWGFRPSGEADQSIDVLEKVYIPVDYKNMYGSSWFDFYFKVGSEEIGANNIKSSNTNVVQFLNFDNAIARMKVVGTGETTLTFPTKNGSYTYTKQVVIYDEKAAQVAVNSLFEAADVNQSIKLATDQQAIDNAQKLVNSLPDNIAVNLQATIDKAQKELDARVSMPVLPTVTEDTKTIVIKGVPGARITVHLPDGLEISKTVSANGEATFTIDNQVIGTVIKAIQFLNGKVSLEASTTVKQGAIAAPTMESVTTENTLVKGTGLAGATVTIQAGTITYTGVITTNGTYAIAIPIQAKDTTITASQTKNGVTSSTVSIKVIDNRTPTAPIVNTIKDSDTIITGTGTQGDTIQVTTSAGVKYKSVVAADGKWSVTVLSQLAGTTISVTATAPNGKVSPKNDVIVLETPQEGKLTTNDFTISKDKNIVGTFTGDVVTFRVTIGSNVYKGGTLDKGKGTYTFYALDKAIQSGIFKIEALDKYGKVLDTKTANIVKTSTEIQVGTGTVTANGFVIHQDKSLTGSYTGDVTAVKLVYDGVTYSGGTVANGNYTFYALDKIIDKTKTAYMYGYDAKGNKIATSTISLSDAKDHNTNTVGIGTVQANDFTLYVDGNITGIFTGDVKSIKVRVNDTTYSGGSLVSGQFIFYARDKISGTSQVVVVDGYDSNGNKIATSTVTVKNKGY